MTPVGHTATPSSNMSGFVPPKPQTATTSAEEDREALLKLKAKFDGIDMPPASEKASEPVASKAPEEPRALNYAERCQKFDIDVEKAMVIVDQLMMEGKYTETVKIAREVSVVFTTRQTRFNSYLAKEIDLADPKKVGRMNQVMSELQLAGSLDKYGDTKFDSLDDMDMPDDAWTKVLNGRLDFVRRLPSASFIAICNKLAQFDLKMAVVLSEGYEENF